MRSAVNGLLTALFPQRCILCGLIAGCSGLCGACRADLPWIQEPCAHCGSPLAIVPTVLGEGDAVDRTLRVCPSCRISWTAVARAWSAFIYEYPVDRLITRAKFQDRMDCADLLGEALGSHLRRLRNLGLLTTPDCIVPVPLHPRRLATRGYNQALAIARPVSRCLHVPIRIAGCHRVRNTVEQTSLTGAARRRNLHGAFHVTADFYGQRVAIVDDVLTTGSTMDALATALLEAGAASVQAWSVARTERRALIQPGGTARKV